MAANAAFLAGQDFEFSLFETGAEELVGGLRVNPVVAPGTAEIGYWVRSDRHRRGYATEAVTLATAAAFESLAALSQIEIQMDPANRPSQGVAARAGNRLDREIERLAEAPAHTSRALVWTIQRPRVGEKFGRLERNAVRACVDEYNSPRRSRNRRRPHHRHPRGPSRARSREPTQPSGPKRRCLT